MNLTEKDVQILTQVAFKEASQHAIGVDITTDDGKAKLEGLTVYLTDTLVSAIELAVEKHAKSVATKAPAYSGNSSSGSSDGEFTLRVKGEQHGPIPAWAIKKAQEENVTEVYDNRGRLAENPRLPWFKATDRDIPFWDPASRPQKKAR